jgi:hypothetical protein
VNFRILSTDYVYIAAMVEGSSPTFCCWIDFGCSIHRPLLRYVALYILVPKYVEFPTFLKIFIQFLNCFLFWEKNIHKLLRYNVKKSFVGLGF